MKITYNLILSLAICSLFSCKKGPGSSQDFFNPDYTSIPASTPVQTIFVGYVTTDNNTTPIVPIHLGLNLTDYTCTNGMFNTGTGVSGDQYLTKLGIGTGGSSSYLVSNKTFPASTSPVNFLNIKALSARFIDFIGNNAASTNTFGNSATISFGVNALWQPAQGVYPAEFDPYMGGELYATYLDPTDNEFATRLPCYSMGDDAGKRWFLRSYGAASFEIKRMLGPISKLDFYNGATGNVRLPIPASLLSSAPDTITKWKLKDNVWVKSGVATKLGNFYEGKIDTVTSWNFAVPQNGVYKTVKLRTDSGAAVVNGGIRIKNGARVLFQAQTDADGNAICFIPANENVSIEVVDSWTNNSSPVTTITAAASGSPTIDITISALSNRVLTMKGNAVTCSGNPIPSGLIIAKNNLQRPTDYYFVIKNGQYNAAILATSGGTSYALRAKSYSNDEGVDTMVSVTAGKQNIYSLNTCIPATNLFMNYSFDGASTSITGDMSHPYTPFLGAIYSASPTPKTTLSAASSIQFDVQVTQTGTFTLVQALSITINGVYYNESDISKPSKLIFTRYDNYTNGYVIGSADFYVTGAGNISHHVIASFKMRRT
jgi:hypothetical protein